jgi:hypothetical protein
MNTKDLIKQLQKLVEEHEPHVSVMGEHEIMIDFFQRTKDRGVFLYKGFCKDVEIQLSEDGVYHILSAKGTFD